MQIAKYLIALVCLIQGASGQGQRNELKEGVKVVTLYSAPLRHTNEQVGIVLYDLRGVYTIVQVKGEELLLDSGRVKGWILASKVIPFDKAIEFYSDEIRGNPSRWEAYNCRGIIWYIKNDLEKSICDFNDVIRINPKFALAYCNRANALCNKLDYDRAIADYDEAIRLDPIDADAFSGRGGALWHKRNYDRAIADYDEAIRLKPNDAMSHFSRAGVWQSKKQYDLAIAGYDEAIRLDPSNAKIYLNRGYSRSCKEDYDLAIADYDEAIRLDPSDALVYNHRAYAWVAKENYDRAISDYQKSIQIDQTNSYSFMVYAWLLATCPAQKYRDGNKAIELAEKACKLDSWKVAKDLDALAAAHAEVGNFDQAVKFQTEAIRLDSIEGNEITELQERIELYKMKIPYHDS